MCCDQLQNFTGNITLVSSPAACTGPSVNALEHNYISGRVCTTKKRQSQAFHFYILNSGIPEPSLKEKSQWIRDAYKKYKVFLSNQRNCGTTFISFTKCYLKKGQRENPVHVMLQAWTANKYIACFGSQSSGFLSSSPIAPGSFRVETCES